MKKKALKIVFYSLISHCVIICNHMLLCNYVIIKYNNYQSVLSKLMCLVVIICVLSTLRLSIVLHGAKCERTWYYLITNIKLGQEINLPTLCDNANSIHYWGSALTSSG